MPRPPDTLVVKWRKLAEEGYLYAEIARMDPQFSINQVRHYCLGYTGRKLPGPIQRVDRWYGSKVWMRGDNSPHARLTADRQRRSWTTGTRRPTDGRPPGPNGRASSVCYRARSKCCVVAKRGSTWTIRTRVASRRRVVGAAVEPEPDTVPLSHDDALARFWASGGGRAGYQEGFRPVATDRSARCTARKGSCQPGGARGLCSRFDDLSSILSA